MKNQICIGTDPFFIIQRLKEIDNSYYVVFNTKTHRYEVHSSCQGKETFCFTVDKALDESVIIKAHRTKVQNSAKLLKEIERHNASLENKAYERAMCEIQKEAL